MAKKFRWNQAEIPKCWNSHVADPGQCFHQRWVWRGGARSQPCARLLGDYNDGDDDVNDGNDVVDADDVDVDDGDGDGDCEEVLVLNNVHDFLVSSL